MKIFNFSILYKYRLYIAMALAIVVGISLISYSIMSVFITSKTQYKTSIFSLNSYFAIYNLTVKSNKNVNTYSIEEWYKKDEEEKFKFKYKDFMDNMYSIIVYGDKYKIENTNQISKYVSKSYKNATTNLYSLATYINIINDDAFYVESEISEVTSTYIIDFTKPKNEEMKIKYEDIVKNAKNITSAKVTIIANKPVKISIFSGNEEKIIIEYEDFKQDELVEDEIFEV